LQQVAQKHVPARDSKKLPGYLLPKQKARTEILKTMLKAKFFRMRIGKTGQRPKRLRYGRDDRVVSKMNI
ncbi:hypothetical protein BJ742DRAFT_675885, partial [Cladochytrium replicatum]